MGATTWLIAFVDCGSRPWYRFFVRPHFQHCYALGIRPETSRYVLVEWSRIGLRIVPLEHNEVAEVWEMMKSDTITVIWHQKFVGRRRFRPLSVPCVSIVKEILGIRCLCWTPYQFFCALKRRGAPVIFGVDKLKEQKYGWHRFLRS